MRGPGPGIEIPPYAITRGSASASQQQVISLGDTKWTQEILRPMSVVSQSETTTTKQHNYKTTPDGVKGTTGADVRDTGADDPSGEEEQEERRRRPAAAAAEGRREGEEGEQEEEEEGTTAQQPVVSPSSSSSSRRRRSGEQQQQQQRHGGGHAPRPPRSSWPWSRSRSSDDASSSSSLLSQPGRRQEPGRPRGNPRPPGDILSKLPHPVGSSNVTSAVTACLHSGVPVLFVSCCHARRPFLPVSAKR
jgi:hypothetical protein